MSPKKNIRLSVNTKRLQLKVNIQADINIHNLHVWTLAGDKIVGTVHIKLLNVELDKFNQVIFSLIVYGTQYIIYCILHTECPPC